MLKRKSIDYIFGMTTGVLLVFTISCNQPQTKTVDEKVEDIKNMASKVGWKPKEVHVHKTTEWDCRILDNPNSKNVVGRIPKGKEVEILAEQLVKQGMSENTWYKIAYENKIGWVSEHNFNK